MSDYEAQRDPSDASIVQVFRQGRQIMTLRSAPSVEDLREERETAVQRVHGLTVAIDFLENEVVTERDRVARLADRVYQEAKAAGATSTDAMAASLAAVDRDRAKRGVPVR